MTLFAKEILILSFDCLISEFCIVVFIFVVLLCYCLF